MKIPWPWLALFTCSALRQDIEERRSSQDELSAVHAIASYHREGMSLALKNLVSVPPKSCGSILTSVLPVDPTFETQIRRKASLYFRIQTIKQNGNEVKVVYGKGTSWATEQVLGRLLKVGDFDATHMRSLQDLEAHLFRRKSPFGSVTFEVGTDLRSCWGDLYDWEDRKVCDVASLKDLLEDVKKQSEMKMDAVGKSGAAIVTNLRRFILKNLQEEEDPYLVREVIPNFATSIGEKDRDNAGCFKTAVAPICAVLDIPDAVHPGKRVHWVVMRKIELPGQQRSHFQLKDDDDQIDFQDLKGPKFTGLRDGKTFASKKGLGSAQVWHRKDAGFVSLFPTGMRLAYCGSKEAARTLQLDSEMLKNEQMTDYSLFLLPYERGNTRKCFCDDKPRWPLILDTDPYGLRMAVGIIDYLERKVSWFENMFGFSMSTMKEPAEYQNWWMRMWPTYFHLCDFKVNDQGQITGGGHTEQLKIGDRVVALEKIKWFGDIEEARSTQKFNGKWKKCYFGLAHEGSKYKVYPGAKGTVMSFQSCRAAGAGLVINWDKYKWRNKVFQVDPSSVMGEVRQLQRGLA